MKICDLFTLFQGNGFELLNMQETSKSKINFVARTSQNNGVVARVDETAIKPFESGLITVALGGSVLSSFVQNERFYTSFHIMVLKPKQEMTFEQKLFYCMVIQKNAYRYSYGRQANKTLGNIEIPSLDECNRIIGNKKIQQIKTNNRHIAIPLNTANWKEYPIGSLFRLVNGIKYPAEYRETGSLPLVSTSAQNNGITDYILDRKEKFSNIITVAYSGSVGATFYQPHEVFVGETVFGLIPKFNMTKYIGMYLVTVLNYYNYVYSYGRKIIGTRYINDLVKLPTKNNEPDWEYMENYIKNLPYADVI